MDTTKKLLIPASEACKLLSMGKSTFWREVGKGSLPRPIKLGGITRWRVADLERFVDSANEGSDTNTVGRA